MQTVLIVDDDAKLLKMLQRTLAYEGLQVVTASNGEEALTEADACKPDVMILDWMMPKMDGLAVVQELRAEKNPVLILMLTAHDAVENRVEGLQSGADDYLVKPFAPTELVARVHALLRRTDSTSTKEVMEFADVSLDPFTHEVRVGERIQDLTKTEFDLLDLFMRHPRQVLERIQILNSVWGYNFSGNENVLEVYVGYLRKKIEAGGHPRLIQTVRGIGYVLRAEQAE
jgi:two-component system, OmpR family, response regulator MprA